MPNYLLVFHGGTAPQSEEEGRKVMQEWTSWMDGLGAAVVDGGNPVGTSKTISPDGSVKVQTPGAVLRLARQAGKHAAEGRDCRLLSRVCLPTIPEPGLVSVPE